MCDLEKSVPDTAAGPQSITTSPSQFDNPIAQAAGPQTQQLGMPTKTVPTKFGTFLKYALPALQGAAYGAGSATPVRGLGAGGFGASFAGAMGRVGERQQQLRMMQYQMGLEGMDRQMRLLTLQNSIANQQATQDWHRGNLEARLKAIENSNDKEDWTPLATDQGIFEVEKRSGKLRPATPLPEQGQTTAQPSAPMDAGGTGGASPALPTIAGSVPPGMFGNALGINSGVPGAPRVNTPGGAGANTGIAPATVPGAQTGATTTAAGGQLTKSKAAKHSRGEVKLDEGIPTGIYGDNDKLYRYSDPNIPDDLKAGMADAMNAHKQGLNEKVQVARAGAEARGESMGRNRPTTQFDTLMGVTRTVPSGEAEDHPERYHVASYHDIVDTQQKLATINELDKNIDRVNKSADAIKAPGLKPNIIAAGLADPASDLGKQFEGGLIKGLKPEQRDVINYVRNLRQGVAAYKNILSTGGVTDARLNLLEQEMPGIPEIASGDPKIFRQKLKAWTDIYSSVRDQYKPFFQNMLGQTGTTPGSSSGTAEVNPYRNKKKAAQPAQANP